MKKVLFAKQDKAGANGAKVENIKPVEAVENNNQEIIVAEGDQDETSEDEEQLKPSETWETVVARIKSEASEEGIKIAEKLASMQSLYDSAPENLKPHLIGGLEDLKKEAGKISPEGKIKQLPGVFKIAIAGHVEGIMAHLATEGLDPLRLEIIKEVLEKGKLGSTGSTGGGVKETKTHFVFTNEGKQYTSCGNSKSDRQILAEGITEAQWLQVAAKYPFKITEKSTSGFKIEDGKKVYGNIATKAAISQIKNVLGLDMMWKVCEGDEKTGCTIADIIAFNKKEK